MLSYLQLELFLLTVELLCLQSVKVPTVSKELQNTFVSKEAPL